VVHDVAAFFVVRTELWKDNCNNNNILMHKIEQATFTQEIKRNVKFRDILIVMKKQEKAGVIEVYKAQHIVGKCHKELLQNTLEVVIMQLRI